jgi:FixJ family two-component response regulator
LVVEDDDGVRRSLQLLLNSRGYDVRSYAAARPLLESDDLRASDVLVADYRLPDATGVDVLRTLRARGWNGLSILITAFPSDQLIAAAKASGFAAVLEKPLRQQALIAALAG